MVKAVLERGLAAELTEHLGYERGDPAGRGSPNSRNGSHTQDPGRPRSATWGWTSRGTGPGSFEPRLVPKGARRAGGLDEMIISLYAGGMTVRDICHHLARTLGIELSHETISKITDAVLEEVKAWQTRPLEELYPILYLDALVVKVRDGHQVRNRAGAHRRGGRPGRGQTRPRDLGPGHRGREVLGRGVRRAAQPRRARRADRLLRRADRVPRGDRGHLAADHGADLHGAPDPGGDAVRRPTKTARSVAAALRPIYTAPTVEAAESELLAFADSDARPHYPATVATWENAWERFIPFLAFPPEVRKIIYTTNADRVPELPAPQDHQKPGALPDRRRRDQAAVAGHPRHRRQTRPSTAPRRKACPATSAPPPAGSSKAPASKAGNPPSAPSPWPTPTINHRTRTASPAAGRLTRPAQAEYT